MYQKLMKEKVKGGVKTLASYPKHSPAWGNLWYHCSDGNSKGSVGETLLNLNFE